MQGSGQNESKGQIEIAATTSAVEDDRTTLVTEAASIPASELVQGIWPPRDAQSRRWRSPRWETAEASEQTVEHMTRHFQGPRAQPEDSLSPGRQVDGGMAQAVLELSSDKRT